MTIESPTDRRRRPAHHIQRDCPLGDPQPDIRTVGRAATATCEGAVSYDLSGERLTERGLSGRPHPAPGPRTRRASAGQRYIRWFFRQYYRDPFETWDQLSPHSLRHSAIIFALDAGATLRDVQDYAGHKDPRTTRRYDRSRDSLDRNAAYTVAAYLA